MTKHQIKQAIKPSIQNVPMPKIARGGVLFSLNKLFFTLFILFLLPFSSFSQASSDADKLQQYLAKEFNTPPIKKKIWLLADTKTTVADILGHPYKQMRVSYWIDPAQPSKSVWLLHKIGKERYIDVAITIDNNTIQKLRILAFRESRGWEVKLPFFTKQFDQNKLTEDLKLTNRVDNISGATLSWHAVTKLARMALYLDSKRTDRPKVQ